jgi:dynein heavy chain
MPFSSGSIRWAAGILDRFVPKFHKYAELSDTLTKSEEYQEVQKLYEAIKEKIEKYQNEKKEQFYQFVNNSCIDKLKLYLLKYKDEKCNSLKVNFDPALVRLLKEVKYFLQFGLEVPDNAQKI